MSQNYSKEIESNTGATTASKKSLLKKCMIVLGLVVWVLFSFALAQALLYGAVYGLALFGLSFNSINETLFNSIYSVVVYALTVFFIIGLPYFVKKNKTSLEELGLNNLPRWRDLLVWVPMGVLAYLILTSIIASLAQVFMPFVDYTETQETGFDELSSKFQYFLAFFTLVMAAPFFEEIIFRGYLFGKMKKYIPGVVAAIITSIAFGMAHGQWNVGLDVFALSLVLCLLRITTKSIWPSIFLHMLKNATAYYLLFINTSLMSTLGG